MLLAIELLLLVIWELEEGFCSFEQRLLEFDGYAVVRELKEARCFACCADLVDDP